jgi:hypothetical protein
MTKAGLRYRVKGPVRLLDGTVKRIDLRKGFNGETWGQVGPRRAAIEARTATPSGKYPMVHTSRVRDDDIGGETGVRLAQGAYVCCHLHRGSGTTARYGLRVCPVRSERRRLALMLQAAWNSGSGGKRVGIADERDAGVDD